MGKKKVVIAVIFVTVVLTLGYVFVFKSQPKNEIIGLDSNNQLIVDMGEKQISGLEISIGDGEKCKIEKFVTNNSLFNGEFKNKKIGSQTELGLGIMKTTAELPQGKVIVGKIVANCYQGLVVESGLVVGPNSGGAKSEDIRLNSVILKYGKYN